MSMPLVIDASVALKWVLAEEFTDRARALLAHSLHSRQPLLGPPLLLAEITNALYQRLRRRDLTETEANDALAALLVLPLRLVGPSELYQQAWEFARSHGLKNTYDSLYVVLAQVLGAELWTDDRLLVRAVKRVAPWVRWIGDYPLAEEREPDGD